MSLNVNLWPDFNSILTEGQYNIKCYGYPSALIIAVTASHVCVKSVFFFRIYTEVYHAKTSFSPTSEPIIPIREAKELQNFFEEFYSEIDVTPEEVEYIEAHGAGK